MWRDVHAAGPSCIASLTATSAICCEEVPHRGFHDDENCCEPREQSPSEKRAEGNGTADPEEKGNQKLLVRCLLVMEACLIKRPS